MRIQAAVFDKQDGPFQLQDVELDEPGAGEVLVRITATGICHTDGLARHGDLPFPAPGVLGHEGAGVVIAMGPGVTSVREGDHVVIGWPWCGECRNCLAGEPRYCARLGELLVSGVRPGTGASALRRPDGGALHGHFFGQSSFATHSLARANSLVKVPHDVPLDLLGPLACGLSTGAGAVLNTLRPQTGSSLVIYGTGSVGLAAVMAARNSGATTIVAVDRHTSRLELAAELGATHTVNAADADPVAAVHDLCGGPADNALECTGIISVVRQAADSVGMLGTCALIGGAPAGAEFTLDHLTTLWGKRIVGVLGGGGRSTQLIGALIELYRQGRFPMERLVSWFAFDQIEQALEASYAGDVIKPIVRMPA
nr:NAD(P)-dependent alcohol dehydrogenase [Streptomyces sp. NBC_00886]